MRLPKVLPQILILTLISALSACSPLHLVNSVIDDDAFTVTNNLAYGTHSLQKLDIYQPATPCVTCPVLIWFHGFAWQTGSKNLYPFIGETFTRAGMVVVIPDYRKLPNKFPDFMHDAAQVIGWVRANISRFGGNLDNLNLMGHSSGAHISVLLAFDHHYLQAAQVPIDAIKSVVGLAGPYDFLPLKMPDIKQVFADANPLEISQPINFASADAPPVLLAVGLKDQRVKPKNSINMAAAIHAKGGQVQLVSYPEMGHSRILLALSRPFKAYSTVYQDVLAHFKKTAFDQ